MLRAGAGRDGGYAVAIKSVLNIDPKELSKEWHAAEFEAFKPIAESTKMPGQFARVLIAKGKGGGGNLNVGPELSPDGSKVIYFSEKDLFSVDLFLADAKTGEVIRKITNTATSAHYESLAFLTSAGAWDPQGNRFVFPGLAKGEPILTIVDVNNGRTEREIRLTEVHEVVNPTWSPDGKQIAFSALIGGFNDLFVYDLEKSALRRLTTDPFAEVDPAWSPDGQQLVFSTDRFTTNLEVVKSGALKLALLDVGSGTVTQLGGFDNAKNIGAQWAADGQSIFFVSDRQGISNIYRIVDEREPDDAADEHADGRERHHVAEPGDVGGGRPARVQRLRRGQLQHLRARHRGAADGRGAGRSAAQRRRPAAAARRRRPGRRGAAGSDVGPAGKHAGAGAARNTSRNGGSTGPASRRWASASIRSARTRRAAWRSSSATCSAIT